MSVTLRATTASPPVARARLAMTSAQTNVEAWPTWVTSYGVIPQVYIRSGPTGSSVRPSILRAVGGRSWSG
jgi:hypothetical protein